MLNQVRRYEEKSTKCKENIRCESERCWVESCKASNPRWDQGLSFRLARRRCEDLKRIWGFLKWLALQSRLRSIAFTGEFDRNRNDHRLSPTSLSPPVQCQTKHRHWQSQVFLQSLSKTSSFFLYWPGAFLIQSNPDPESDCSPNPDPQASSKESIRQSRFKSLPQN